MIVALFLVLSGVFMPLESRTSRVVLRIEGIQQVKGEIRIAVFDSKQSYAKQAHTLAVVPVFGNVCEWEVPSLGYGEYAVAVYHDANGNTQLDTNLVGAPTEAYGFSNNARGIFGPPSWEKARIMVNQGALTISIRLK